VVIVQHFSGSVKQYAEAVPFPGRSFTIPDTCPHLDCQANGSLIRWGTYERWACTGVVDYRILIQRVRCKVCGRTHSLLPDFLHPHRHYVVTGRFIWTTNGLIIPRWQFVHTPRSKRKKPDCCCKDTGNLANNVACYAPRPALQKVDALFHPSVSELSGGTLGHWRRLIWPKIPELLPNNPDPNTIQEEQ
jgi:hypothetical protein